MRAHTYLNSSRRLPLVQLSPSSRLPRLRSLRRRRRRPRSARRPLCPCRRTPCSSALRTRARKGRALGGIDTIWRFRIVYLIYILFSLTLRNIPHIPCKDVGPGTKSWLISVFSKHTKHGFLGNEIRVFGYLQHFPLPACREKESPTME